MREAVDADYEIMKEYIKIRTGLRNKHKRKDMLADLMIKIWDMRANAEAAQQLPFALQEVDIAPFASAEQIQETEEEPEPMMEDG